MTVEVVSATLEGTVKKAVINVVEQVVQACNIPVTECTAVVLKMARKIVIYVNLCFEDFTFNVTHKEVTKNMRDAVIGIVKEV